MRLGIAEGSRHGPIPRGQRICRTVAALGGGRTRRGATAAFGGEADWSPLRRRLRARRTRQGLSVAMGQVEALPGRIARVVGPAALRTSRAIPRPPRVPRSGPPGRSVRARCGHRRGALPAMRSRASRTASRGNGWVSSCQCSRNRPGRSSGEARRRSIRRTIARVRPV